MIRNFIINLDELHQLRSNAHVIKTWLSQHYVNVRLPYQEDEITASRIASFLGSTNDVEFLRSDLGHSRWISFEIDSIEYLYDEARYILEKSWEQAYYLYKLDASSGELNKEELLELTHRSDQFTTKWTNGRVLTESYGFDLNLKLNPPPLCIIFAILELVCLVKRTFVERKK